MSEDHCLFIALDQPIPLELGESWIDGFVREANFGGNHLPRPLELHPSHGRAEMVVEIAEHTAAGGFDVQQFDMAAERLYLPREVAGKGESSSKILAQRSEQRAA